MAIEKKFFFVGISILFGLAYISTLYGSTADRIVDRYRNVRISPDVNYSGLNSLKFDDFNETRVIRDTPRRIVYRRESYYSLLRTNLDSHLRSYFREEKSRIGEIFSRSREFERIHSRDLNSNTQFRSDSITKRVISPNIERLERSNDNVRFRLEKLTYDPIERIGRIERNEFRNLQVRNSRKPEFRFLDSLTRRFERSSTDRRETTTLRRRMERLSDRRERTDVAIHPLHRTYRVFFQQMWDWGAIIHSKVDGISNYLLTLIAGLFIFDTMGQMVPKKSTEEKGVRNFLRNMVLVTGNTMVH